MSKEADLSQKSFGDGITENSVGSNLAQEKTLSSSVKTKKSSLDGQEETVDPRVQVELEKLNTATDLINKLEIELDEARANFRLLLTESSQRINQQAVKLGACIEKARPYYEARMKAKELQQETQKAALRFERASSAHSAAKEMVRLSEEGLCTEGRTFDPAWQEMLNHATMKVNEAEQERRISKAVHQRTSQAYNEAEQNVHQLHVHFKKAIAKSSLSARRSLLQLNNLSNQHQLQLLPYFEMKAQFNQLLEEQKRKVHNLEENVMQVKLGYSEALRNLERISDEIHTRRKKKEEEKLILMEQRTDGVGAEDPPPHFNGAIGQGFSSSAAAVPPPTYQAALESMQENILPEENKSVPAMPLNFVVQKACLAEMEELTPMTPQAPDPFLLNDFGKETSSGPVTLKENSYCSEVSETQHDSILSHEGKPTQSPTDHSSLKPISPLRKSSHLDSISNQKAEGGTPLRNPNFDPLRNPRGEEMSDTESLASTDTADTLDDHQIECLLLDRVLELDYQDLLASTTDIVSTP